MTPQQQKIQAQLELRASELDAKEKYLNSLELSYSKLKLDIKVAEETLSSKQSQRDKLIKDKEKLQESIVNLESDYKKQSFKFKNQLNEDEQTLNNTKSRIKESKTLLSELINNQDSIKKEIIELKKYINNQETMIAEAIESGNDVLLSIKSDIAGLEVKKNDIIKEIENLEHEKEQVGYSLVLIRQHYEEDNANFELEREKMREKLMKAQQEYAKTKKAQNILYESMRKEEQKLVEIKTSITAEHNALTIERQQLEIDKRRLKNPYQFNNDI